jgi:hypothetical protein
LSPTETDPYGADIYTEENGDPDTLANLGPIRPMAGVFEGIKGADEHPIDEGAEQSAFIERYELYPVDFQTNGPQIFYGLRYHTNIRQVGSPAMFHDQVGYWLWEPLANSVTLTLGIPRGQALIAMGHAEVNATDFELRATAGADVNGIVSNPFLDRAFHTSSYRIHVTIHDDDTWSYEEEGVLEISGRDSPFHHTDRNMLTRVSLPLPNPLSQHDVRDSSLGIGSLRNESGYLP